MIHLLWPLYIQFFSPKPSASHWVWPNGIDTTYLRMKKKNLNVNTLPHIRSIVCQLQFRSFPLHQSHNNMSVDSGAVEQHLIYVGLLHFISFHLVSLSMLTLREWLQVLWQSTGSHWQPKTLNIVASLTKCVFVVLITQTDNKSAWNFPPLNSAKLTGNDTAKC